MERLKFFLIVSISFLMVWEVFTQEISWQLKDHDGHPILILEGLSQTGSSALTDLEVYVGQRVEWPGEQVPAILGKVMENEESLVFQPALPFREALDYTAFWGRKHAFTFTIPSNTLPTSLSAIYPSSNMVPANLLKIYLYFSAPMGEGQAYQHLSLLRSDGDTIHQPFVPLYPELWSADRTRLTLWLDPGRIKRGLLSHQAHGPVIEQGRTYTLLVHADWKDASGKKLGKAYQKRFQVGAPDYQQPQPAVWKYQFPKAGTVDPLRIDFGESLDQALAGHSLSVYSESGLALAGNVILKRKESQWCFYPEEAWLTGHYTIRVDGILEDLAGNSLNRPFEREIIPGEAAPTVQDFYTIQFTVKLSE